MDLIGCSACGRSVSPHAAACPHCGQARAAAAAAPAGDEAVATVIPYRNKPALVGYYLAIFGLIPCLGAFLAPPAVVLGILGLRAVGRDPRLKGTAHAWIGIGLGGVLTLVYLAVLLSMVGFFRFATEGAQVVP